MKKRFFIGIFTILILFSVSADVRTENIDLFLVLDKSLSMVEEIEDVKTYVNDFLVDAFVIPGDRLTVINFYGSADTVISREVDADSAKDLITRELSRIRADGRFTDIGNALDALNREYYRSPEDGRKKYLLLLTDGVQEAPPESKYQGPQGYLNHDLLETTKTIQRRGWKIQIIGIGDASAAREIAQELSAAYDEVSRGEVSPESLARAGEGITGVIEVSDGPVFTRLDKNGGASMKFSVASRGYTAPRTLAVGGIYYQDGRHSRWNLLEGSGGLTDLNFSIAPGETRDFDISLTFPLPKDGEKGLSGSVFFVFNGNTSITPAFFNVDIQGPFKFPFIILYILGGLILLLLLVLLIRKIAQGGSGGGKGSGTAGKTPPAKTALVPGKSVKTSLLEVDCRFKGTRELKKSFELPESGEIFINSKGFGLDFSGDEIADSLAKAKRVDDSLVLEVLKPKNIEFIAAPRGNILGKEINCLLPGKREVSLLFSKRENGQERK